MRKTIWTGLCSAIVGLAAATMTAQTTPPAQGSAANQRVTVTGCLQEAPANPAPQGGMAETTGTTGTMSTSSGPQYVLTNATVSSPDASAAGPAGGAASAPGTTGTSGSGTAAAESPGGQAGSAGQTYRLLLPNPAVLTPHVGKKLELTGTLQQSSASGATDGASPAIGASALRVQSGKVVAASCTP